VYDALRANPAIWARSALIVTYDEHGGFYDHVVPPGNVPNPDGINSPSPGDPPYAPVFKFDRLGLRVPTVIASPWVKPGRVDSTLYQHTSVLATLDKLFGLTGSLTRRDAAANSFDGLFSELTELRSDTPVKLPRSSLPTVPLTAADPRHPANLPLDADQMDILQRVYHLTADIQPQQITAATLPRTQADAHEFVRASLQQYMMNMAK
jgi:phospholipase C